jgi:hypothetical protein
VASIDAGFAAILNKLTDWEKSAAKVGWIAVSIVITACVLLYATRH